MFRFEIRLCQNPANTRHQIRLRNLFAGKVDADEKVAIARRLPLPFRQLMARALEYPLTNRNDQAGLFRERNKVRWIDEAALRMVPANQRFKAGELSGSQHHDWL